MVRVSLILILWCTVKDNRRDRLPSSSLEIRDFLPSHANSTVIIGGILQLFSFFLGLETGTK